MQKLEDLHIISSSLRNNKNPNVKKCHYVGTAGSLIDVSIFNEKSKLWDIPTDLPKGVTIYNIEDLWLSYICYHYGYTLKRSFLPESGTLNTKNSSSEKNSLYQLLKKEKQLLFSYLLKKNWFL